MTQFLAQFFGIYFAIMCVALILKHQRVRTTAWQMLNQPPVLMLTAIVTLLLGTALILSHNVWVSDWRVIITVICWLVFTKGLFLLFLPEKAEVTMILMQDKRLFYVTWVLYAAVAATLLYYGFCNQ